MRQQGEATLRRLPRGLPTSAVEGWYADKFVAPGRPRRPAVRQRCGRARRTSMPTRTDFAEGSASSPHLASTTRTLANSTWRRARAGGDFAHAGPVSTRPTPAAAPTGGDAGCHYPDEFPRDARADGARRRSSARSPIRCSDNAGELRDLQGQRPEAGLLRRTCRRECSTARSRVTSPVEFGSAGCSTASTDGEGHGRPELRHVRSVDPHDHAAGSVDTELLRPPSSEAPAERRP